MGVATQAGDLRCYGSTSHRFTYPIPKGAEIADLHLWQVGPGHCSAIVSVVATNPKPPAAYKALLAGLPMLSHVTVEVNPRIAAM
ncbi:putative inner membrane protein [Bosea sp. LC85]|nr:putative inner membrane protein [Bosea sp. LC85]